MAAKWASVVALAMLPVAAAVAQAPPPPPPPPIQPLAAPPVPAANPQSAAKISLGQALFWDEQLSLTGTVACGTCHRPFAGGGDPRSALAEAGSRHPGPDAVLGTPDDIVGSQGVPSHDGAGHYHFDPVVGFLPQVGARSAGAAVNAGYSPTLFWDGRAAGTFVDPRTGESLIAQGGALENQALGPLINPVEMSPAAADVNAVPARIVRAVPLVLADSVPVALEKWIAGRDYPALFEEVFGTPQVSAARIAMALASYERSLASTQTPFDSENAGVPALTALERQGRQVFVANDCAACHAGALLSDNQFHYLGLRPATEDTGRFAVTGNAADRGRFRTPSLRNAALRTSFMHTGRFSTLEEVVDFYDRGGDFTAPNKDPRVRPRNLTTAQKTALLAFLRRPLTDLRVAAETGPFARPSLFTEGTRVPQVSGVARSGSGAVAPMLGAIEPALIGRRFTVTIDRALGAAKATLVVSRSDPGLADAVPPADFAAASFVLEGSGSGGGHGSISIDLGLDPALAGVTLFGRAYIEDAGAQGGLAITPAFSATVFGRSWAVFADAFE